jgi:hemin uptake protein HemP
MVDESQDGIEQSTEPSQLPRTWESAELFGDSKLIHIEHTGETYQLRITRQGKLILNK